MQLAIHPQAQYRDRLLREVTSWRPGSVLEIGCGSGVFLRSAAANGLNLHGIDPDTASVREIQGDGFVAQVGVAEALPFQAASFDLAVFSYTAHHIADWAAALAEALRVCRLGVVVLDPWYDDRIPSQAVARAFDRWCKRIDRSNGTVHNDCLDAAALLGVGALRRPDLSVKYEYMLVLSELGVSGLESAAAAKLAEAKEPERWRPELANMVRSAHASGFSDDGAILLVITKHGET